MTNNNLVNNKFCGHRSIKVANSSGFHPLGKAINCNNDLLGFAYADWKRSYNINTDSVPDMPRFNVMIA